MNTGEISSENEIVMTMQQELWEEGEPSYISFSRGDLASVSEVMCDLLREKDVRPGDRILIYDYNTSLSTMVMSRVFTPGLDEGVCEKMGCLAICTDGLSELAARSAFVFTHWKPNILLIRSDLIAPLRSNLKTNGLKESNQDLRTVFILHNDVAPWPRNKQLGGGDFDRLLLYKLDQSLFMCIVKPCGGLYYPNYAYRVSYAKEQIEVSERKSAKQKLLIYPNFSMSIHHAISSSLECESPKELCYCGERHEFRTEEFSF